ncbi:G-protein coupled receptor dmsr-1 [Pseudolycoriella hygida]|uniref:G-protein coupled receptor dmsr-1 n=1 Tax=Pseudolycoriella hygida TaxID=35572 RepID=A0A9Q0S5D0_9DIPT|nr:G-protein coupled receptor dmsr-1 [Pseudolycoriella hygida]
MVIIEHFNKSVMLINENVAKPTFGEQLHSKQTIWAIKDLDMDNQLRQKVYEWLLRIISNSSIFEQQQKEKSQINISINEQQIELTTKMDMQSGATNFFKKYNLTDMLQYNITPEYINAFLEILNISKPHPPKVEVESCTEYCDGSFRDALLGYKSFHGYVSLVVCIFGTIANILNIIVLTRKDMSKTPINMILKWLAVADMFVMIEYIPFSYFHYISPEGHRYAYTWATFLLFHMNFTQILHTISISLTVTLAVWRYVAIKHPHGKFATHLLSHCGEAILVSFVISPILCMPTYFVFQVNEQFNNDTDSIDFILDAEEDTWLYSVNFWVHSVIIKLLPCLVLTVISFILIRVLCQAAKRKVKLKGYSQPTPNMLNSGHRPSRCEKRTDRTTMLLVAVLLLFLITEFPQGILGLLSGILPKCFFIRCYQMFGDIMDLLALINAAVGFVLYGLMSKQFRTSFKAVFFKTRLSNIEMTRITGLNTTCV